MNDIEEEESIDLDNLLYITDSTDTISTKDTIFITHINNTTNTTIYLDNIIFIIVKLVEYHIINLISSSSPIINLTSPNLTFIDLTLLQPTYLDLRSPNSPIIDEYTIFQQEAWEEVFLQ